MVDSFNFKSLKNDLIKSERKILESVCHFEDKGHYEVFYSPEYPNYYAGNGLIIKSHSPKVMLDDWISIFREFFPQELYKHMTIVFVEEAIEQEKLAQARESGFFVFTESFWARPYCKPEIRDANITPELLSFPNDRELLFRLHLEDSINEDWFEGVDEFEKLFDKTMTVTNRVGIKWIGLKSSNENECLMAALGFFEKDNSVRLQEVITMPKYRRKGYASLLINSIPLFTKYSEKGTVLMTEKYGEGEMLYKSLGFSYIGESITVMKY